MQGMGVIMAKMQAPRIPGYRCWLVMQGHLLGLSQLLWSCGDKKATKQPKTGNKKAIKKGT